MKSKSKEKKKGKVQHVLLPDFLSASGAPNTPTFATHAQYTNKPDANGALNTPTFATHAQYTNKPDLLSASGGPTPQSLFQ